MSYQKERPKLKSFDELNNDCKGNWAVIFRDLAPELDAAMSAASKPGMHVPCPVHGGRDGFRMYKDYPDTGGGVCNTCGPFPSGWSLLMWLRGWSMKDTVREVGAWDRNERGIVIERRAAPPPPPPMKVNPAKALKQIKEIWLATQPLRGTAGEKYLLNRGIWPQNQSNVLRFHPSLSYYSTEEQKVIGRWPAIVAPIKNAENRIVALHRIYITAEGFKAPVGEAKKMTSACDELPGSAIKLWLPQKTLGIAEGIETASAAHAVSRLPVWSCVNTALLAGLVIPDGVEHLVIFADKDVQPKRKPWMSPDKELVPPGQHAAEKLAERAAAQGVTSEIHYPPGAIPEGSKSIDWLDVLNSGEGALSLFPEKWRRWKPEHTELAA